MSTAAERWARELAAGGVVLDVGCGGGAAGLALVPPAGRVVGFDRSAELLELFVVRAAELGVDHETVEGSWPEVTEGLITGRYYQVPRPQEPFGKGNQLFDYFEFDWRKRQYVPNKL